jgi:hypothetical protein
MDQTVKFQAIWLVFFSSKFRVPDVSQRGAVVNVDHENAMAKLPG